MHGMDLAELRAYQFLMEGQLQSAMYMTVLLCYPFAMWAQGGETLDGSRPYNEEELEQVLARGLFPHAGGGACCLCWRSRRRMWCRTRRLSSLSVPARGWLMFSRRRTLLI